jgi:hypothetical protein
MRPALWNEQIKLLANLLNTCAGSFFTVWVVAPAAAFLYTGGQSGGRLWAFLAGAPIGVFGAFLLHGIARKVLTLLRE